MIVVSDTSPLNYLILIETAEVLPVIFECVYIPTAVASELTNPAAPAAVKHWMSNPPAWLIIQNPGELLSLTRLDPGEIAAISLAQELHADHLLVDECSARATAAALGLHVIGTLGVLKQAAERRLIDLQASLNRLLATTYRIDPALVQRLIEDHRESRQ